MLAVYTPDGRAEVIGTNTGKVLDKHIRRIARHKEYTKKKLVQFQQNKSSGQLTRQEKSKMRRQLTKVRRKYYNAEARSLECVKHIHYRVAHYLCQRHEQLIMPDFSRSGVVQGKLRPNIKRRLTMLRFGKFTERLKQVSTAYHVRLFSGSEAYTSKQCGQCGHLNENLGGKEVFTCSRCSATADRDVHAARNIFLRFCEKHSLH
jgi:putative transposase